MQLVNDPTLAPKAQLRKTVLESGYRETEGSGPAKARPSFLVTSAIRSRPGHRGQRNDPSAGRQRPGPRRFPERGPFSRAKLARTVARFAPRVDAMAASIIELQIPR